MKLLFKACLESRTRMAYYRVASLDFREGSIHAVNDSLLDDLH